jgi:hypothetical protein
MNIHEKNCSSELVNVKRCCVECSITQEEHIMATYKQISERVKETFGRVPKTCHIADVKASFGLTNGPAPNRLDKSLRAYPCPAEMRPHIEAALRHIKIIEP